MPLLRLEGTVLGMTVRSDTSAPDDVAPDPAMIALYADVVFGYCEGWVPVRALAEKGAADAPPHTPFIEADAELAARLALQAAWAADAGMALFVVPGTVAAPGEARAEHVAQTQVVLVDLDHGDIGAKRDASRPHLGMPDPRGRLRRRHRRGPAQAAPLLAADRARRGRGHRHGLPRRGT